MANYDIVEGDWADGKYMFRKVQPEDWDAVVEHIQKYFLHDEPTSKLMGYTDEYGSEIGKLARRMLADDLSFLVEETATGEIVAVRVTLRQTPNTNFDDIPLETRQAKVLMKLCDVTDQMAGLYERFEVDQIADFFVASCATEHRQHGITTEMYERNLKFLKAEGFKLCKSLFTSPYTRAAVRKLGFKEICRLDYRDLYDPDGELAFDPEDLTPDHFAAVMVKEI